jgi:hypothetical protein
MEFKRRVTNFTYRIDPRPEGGFIAHATDPTAPPLEAASREELLQKIEVEIAANVASKFPGLSRPLEKQLKSAFHLDGMPSDGFATHSANPNEPATGESPIIPKGGPGRTIFRFLFALLVVATLLYFFSHHR